MRIKHFMLGALSLIGLCAQAETVLLEDNFSQGSGYYNSFSLTADVDAQIIHSSISGLFYSSVADAILPWWIGTESSDSPDVFVMSHAYYNHPDEANPSDDWLISKPLIIDSEGYLLEFDAQSIAIRDTPDNWISSLWLYVIDETETGEITEISQLPTQYYKYWEQIPYGSNPYVSDEEGAWTRYTVSLDEFAGRQVRICFVNKNHNKDVLAINYVKIAREDNAMISFVDFPEYVTDTEIEVSVNLEVLSESGLSDYCIEITDGRDHSVTYQVNEAVECGFQKVYTMKVPLVQGDKVNVTARLSSSQMAGAVTITSDVTRLNHFTTRRVFIEESTGLWCGWCPLGIILMEKIDEDPELSERVVPVCLHIPGPDPLANTDYQSYLGAANAPNLFINRNENYITFTTQNDAAPAKDDNRSVLCQVATLIDEFTPIDIDIQLTPIVENGDTVEIEYRALLRPAINLPSKSLSIGAILTEDNVGLDNNAYFIQHNYLSGGQYENGANGWETYPDNILNLKYHHVLRNFSRYNGANINVELLAGKEYEFTGSIKIPDTYQETSTQYCISPAVNPANCNVVVFVRSTMTNMIENAAMASLVEHKRKTAAQCLNADPAGVEDIIVPEHNQTPVYFDLQGIRYQELPTAAGIYILKQGAKVQKVLVK